MWARSTGPVDRSMCHQGKLMPAKFVKAFNIEKITTL